MKLRPLPLFAGALIVVVGVSFGLAAALLAPFGVGGTDATLIVVATGAWYLVGALIVALRPGNVIGWMFSAIGLLWASGLTLSAYAEHTERATGGLLTFATWYSEWFWIAALVLTVASMYVFPTGTVAGRRWRQVLGALLLFSTAAVIRAALEGTVQVSEDGPALENPVGIAGLGDIEKSAAIAPLFVIGMVGAAVLGVISIVIRYRRSDGVERGQIKWMAIGGPLAVVIYILAGVLDALGFPSNALFPVALCVIPVAAGIAILRHQLYDVDRLISRTLVYGALTVILGAAYVGLVLAGQALFSSFAGGSNLAIAASTLVVAALFLPVRSRVQGFVDRRFYRRRYDAQRTLEAFGSRLREQVDLDGLATDLRGVVQETMQPEKVSLWLRSTER
ncbi:MAG: hypothetical protein LH654_03295 [Thermoleophilia bacterium]|nr:hypothetical protein [Thermoleophilia bacterium]